MRINITNSIQTAPGGAAPQIQTVIQRGRGNQVGQDGIQGNLAGLSAKKVDNPQESPAAKGGPEATKGPDAAQGAGGQDKGIQDLKELLGKALQMVQQLLEQLQG